MADSRNDEEHDHPKAAPSTDAPMIQARIRVPESVDKREWLMRQSRRRRASVSGKMSAGTGTSSLRSRDSSRKNASPSPGPSRDRVMSMESTASSLATEESYASTTSRLSVASTPALRMPSTLAARAANRRQDSMGTAFGPKRAVSFSTDRGPNRRRSGSLNDPLVATVPPRKMSASGSSSPLSAAAAAGSAAPARCVVCGNEFTRYRRPHRCRACSQVVCATCSPARLPKRTCKLCARGSAAPQVVTVVSPRRRQPPPITTPFGPPPVSPNQQSPRVEDLLGQAAGVARVARRGVGSTARVFVGAASRMASFVAAAGAVARSQVVGSIDEVDDSGERESEALGDDGVGHRENERLSAVSLKGSAGSVGGRGEEAEEGEAEDEKASVAPDVAGKENPVERRQSSTTKEENGEKVNEGMGSLDEDRDRVVADGIGHSSRTEGEAQPARNALPRRDEELLAESTRNEEAAAAAAAAGVMMPDRCGRLAFVSAADQDGGSDTDATAQHIPEPFISAVAAAAGGEEGSTVVSGPEASTVAVADERGGSVTPEVDDVCRHGEGKGVGDASLVAVSSPEIATAPTVVEAEHSEEGVGLDEGAAAQPEALAAMTPAAATSTAGVDGSPTPMDPTAQHGFDLAVPDSAAEGADLNVIVSGPEAGTTADEGCDAVPCEVGGDVGGGPLGTASFAEVSAPPAGVEVEGGEKDVVLDRPDKEEPDLPEVVVTKPETCSATPSTTAYLTANVSGLPPAGATAQHIPDPSLPALAAEKAERFMVVSGSEARSVAVHGDGGRVVPREVGGDDDGAGGDVGGESPIAVSATEMATPPAAVEAERGGVDVVLDQTGQEPDVPEVIVAQSEACSAATPTATASSAAADGSGLSPAEATAEPGDPVVPAVTAESAEGGIVVPGPEASNVIDEEGGVVAREVDGVDGGGERGCLGGAALGTVHATKMAAPPAAMEAEEGDEDMVFAQTDEEVVIQPEAYSATTTISAAPTPPTPAPCASAAGVDGLPPTDVTAEHILAPLVPVDAAESAECRVAVSGAESDTTSDGGDGAVPHEVDGDEGSAAGDVCEAPLAAVISAGVAPRPAAVDTGGAEEDVVLDGDVVSQPEAYSPTTPTAASSTAGVDGLPPKDASALHGVDPAALLVAAESAEGGVAVSGLEAGSIADEGGDAVPCQVDADVSGGGVDVSGASLGTVSSARVAAPPAGVDAKGGEGDVVLDGMDKERDTPEVVVTKPEVCLAVTPTTAALTLPTSAPVASVVGVDRLPPADVKVQSIPDSVVPVVAAESADGDLIVSGPEASTVAGEGGGVVPCEAGAVGDEDGERRGVDGAALCTVYSAGVAAPPAGVEADGDEEDVVLDGMDKEPSKPVVASPSTAAPTPPTPTIAASAADVSGLPAVGEKAQHVPAPALPVFAAENAEGFMVVSGPEASPPVADEGGDAVPRDVGGDGGEGEDVGGESLVAVFSAGMVEPPTGVDAEGGEEEVLLNETDQDLDMPQVVATQTETCSATTPAIAASAADVHGLSSAETRADHGSDPPVPVFVAEGEEGGVVVSAATACLVVAGDGGVALSCEVGGGDSDEEGGDVGGASPLAVSSAKMAAAPVGEGAEGGLEGVVSDQTGQEPGVPEVIVTQSEACSATVTNAPPTVLPSTAASILQPPTPGWKTAEQQSSPIVPEPLALADPTNTAERDPNPAYPEGRTDLMALDSAIGTRQAPNEGMQEEKEEEEEEEDGEEVSTSSRLSGKRQCSEEQQDREPEEMEPEESASSVCPAGERELDDREPAKAGPSTRMPADVPGHAGGGGAGEEGGEGEEEGGGGAAEETIESCRFEGSGVGDGVDADECGASAVAERWASTRSPVDQDHDEEEPTAAAAAAEAVGEEHCRSRAEVPVTPPGRTEEKRGNGEREWTEGGSSVISGGQERQEQHGRHGGERGVVGAADASEPSASHGGNERAGLETKKAEAEAETGEAPGPVAPAGIARLQGVELERGIRSEEGRTTPVEEGDVSRSSALSVAVGTAIVDSRGEGGGGGGQGSTAQQESDVVSLPSGEGAGVVSQVESVGHREENTGEGQLEGSGIGTAELTAGLRLVQPEASGDPMVSSPWLYRDYEADDEVKEERRVVGSDDWLAGLKALIAKGRSCFHCR